MKNMVPYVFIILGVISTTAGFILLKKTPAASMRELAEVTSKMLVLPSSESNVDANVLEVDRRTLKERKVVDEKVSIEREAATLARSNMNPDDTSFIAGSTKNAKEKGDAFEKYVVSKFSSRAFKLLEWQGDKYHNGIYAESTQNPDMVLEIRGEQKKFAVECKWRSGFINGKLQWANDQQLDRYNKYMSENNLPVFIVLGIGGEPSQPDEVYAIPLRKMKYSFATKDYLQQFKRLDASRNFYYEVKDKILK